MPVYFLDASALVKRYVREVGVGWVRSLCQPSAGNIIGISQASTVEAVAAFCRKARTTQAPISVTDRDGLISSFRQDLVRDSSIVPVTQDVYTHAGDLCATYKLRAYDSVQLACALVLRDALARQQVALMFVASDGDLLLAAQGEGLPVDNPNNHP